MTNENKIKTKLKRKLKRKLIAKKLQGIEDLKNAEIGDEVEGITGEDIDFNREGPFLYIDGNCYEGDNNDWAAEHIDLINQYCEDMDIDYDDVHSLNLPIAYGSFYDDSVIIFFTENCSLNDILGKLQGIYNKVFSMETRPYREEDGTAVRIAKKLVLGDRNERRE